MIKPSLCLLSIALTFAISLTLFLYTPYIVEDYFFISVFILIGCYTALSVFRSTEVYEQRKWLQDPLKIIGKYLFWGVLTYLPCYIYENHSFYAETAPNTLEFFTFYFKLYVWLGVPYFILSEKFRYSFDNYINDPYIRFISLFKKLLKGQFSVLKRFYHIRQYKRFLISSFLRLHFITLMVEQLSYTNIEIVTGIQNGIDWRLSSLMLILTPLIWSIDANNASIGYFWESNFTKTRFRAMDTNLVHWFVTMICYLPFIIWITTFVPALDHATEGHYILTSLWFVSFTDVLTLVFLAGYIYSGSSLYFSTSNMTYKAIQTRGMYAIVRHPATFFKLGFFFVSIFKYAHSYTAINIFAYLLWMGIYIGRTICEERFLGNFQEYRDYKLKTKYRIIPGLY